VLRPPSSTGVNRAEDGALSSYGKKMIAIFGGTAAYHLNLSDFATVIETLEVNTDFGPASWVRLMTEAQVEVLFLSRHGAGKLARSAAFVNHRAHIASALELGATGIISWNGVGAINPKLTVGDLVVPDDLLDETRARPLPKDEFTRSVHPSSFILHPFNSPLRSALLAAAPNAHPGGTYVCTEGPRLETPAEIAAFAKLGADIVGMTLVPEVWLAADAGLPYASLCAITNMAAGLSHLNPARDFGPAVGAKCLRVCLSVAKVMAQPRFA